MLTVLSSLISLLVGASIQFYFSKYLDQRKARRENLNKAFEDYFKCVTESAHSSPDLAQAESRRERITNAKCRVCLYASSSTLKAFSNFIESGEAIRGKGREAFLYLVVCMRKESLSAALGDQECIEKMLFGCAMPEVEK